MDVLNKLEKIILGWIKGLPHLPVYVKTWLGDNAWWIILIAVIISVLAILGSTFGLLSLMALLGSASSLYYTNASFATTALITGFIGLAFLIIETALLAFAIKPLKDKQKKGWVLLFASWLVNILSIVVSTVLTFNPLSFVVGLLFGAIGVAITGYFLFEIHDQYAHVERSKGVRGAKVAK